MAVSRISKADHDWFAFDISFSDSYFAIGNHCGIVHFEIVNVRSEVEERFAELNSFCVVCFCSNEIGFIAITARLDYSC
jgi:hypothetical protein